jgi:hypothetical protein
MTAILSEDIPFRTLASRKQVIDAFLELRFELGQWKIPHLR